MALALITEFRGCVREKEAMVEWHPGKPSAVKAYLSNTPNLAMPSATQLFATVHPSAPDCEFHCSSQSITIGPPHPHVDEGCLTLRDLGLQAG